MTLEHREPLVGGKRQKKNMELPSEHLSEIDQSRRRRYPTVKRERYKILKRIRILQSV